MTLSILFRGLELTVQGDYSPSEKAVYNPDSPFFGPGCAESFEVTAVSCAGLRDDTLDNLADDPDLEEACLEQLCEKDYADDAKHERSRE